MILHAIYKRQTQLLLLLLSCIIFVFVVRPWELYFLNDDFIHIPLGNNFLFVRAGFFRPVPNFFLMWDRWLYGKQAVGYFCTSLLLHFICVFTVYLVVSAVDRYILEEDASIRPLLTAMLFLFYPYHAEPVMWIIGRVAIIAAIFALLSIYFYFKAATKPTATFLSWLFFVIALFTYESIWNLVPLFMAISFYRYVKRRGSFKKEVFLSSLMLVSFLGYLFLRKYLLGTVTGNGYTIIQDNLTNFKLLIPNTLKLTARNFTPPFVNSIWGIIFFSGSLLFYAWCVYKLSFKKKLVYLSLNLWLAIVSAVVTAAPLGIDTHYNESERYIYYSSFFYCLFIAVCISYLLSYRMQLWVGVSTGIIFFILFVKLQNNYAESSAVTKSTAQMYSNNLYYKRVIMVDVPAKHYGVPVLRISPQALIDWIVPRATYDTVIVLSQTLNSPLSKPYALKSASWQQLAKEKSWSMDSYTAQDSTGEKVIIGASDLLLWYKPDGLYNIDISTQLPQKKE